MTINRTYGDFTKLDATKADIDAKSLKDAAGLTLELYGCAWTESTDRDGKAVNMVVLKTDQGVYASISPTVMSRLTKIADGLDWSEWEHMIEVEQGVSRAGRNFINIHMVR